MRPNTFTPARRQILIGAVGLATATLGGGQASSSPGIGRYAPMKARFKLRLFRGRTIWTFAAPFTAPRAGPGSYCHTSCPSDTGYTRFCSGPLRAGSPPSS